MLKISEIDQVFKTLFSEKKGLVRTVKSVYELSEDKEFYKLVISIHGLTLEDTILIHTKFIFKTDLDKVNLLEDSFLYLFGINCIYHSVDFTNVLDLEKKIQNIISSNNFSEDIKLLSDFCESPSTQLNLYLKKSKITEYSVFDVKYEPKFPVSKCEDTTFDFEFNINNNYTVYLSIKKIEDFESEEKSYYSFQFKFMDEFETIKSDTLHNLHNFIGSNIIRILDKKLKG